MDLSFQLYSAREYTPWENIFKTVADLGYTQVEGFAAVYENASATRDLLDANQLSMPSGHFFPIGSFEEKLDESLQIAQTLGMRYLICPAPEDAYREGADAAAWLGLAQQLEDAARRVNDAGFRFGWHNHHWEFHPFAGGRCAMELILENAPSIEWEIDVAWLVRADADPLEWIQRYGSRITAAHIKDIAQAGECLDEDGWADIGCGTLDWKTLTAVLRDHQVPLFVVEHDKPADFQRFAKRSIESFRSF